MQTIGSKWLGGLGLLVMAWLAAPVIAAESGLADATVIVIRHGEKPAHGAGLSPQGQARAAAYAREFAPLSLDGQTWQPQHLLASRDSRHSRRETLTLAPLSQTLGLAEDDRFAEGAESALAAELRAHPGGQQILICWHHGAMPQLLTALGADPASVLPAGRWPAAVFDWMIVLRYDAAGHLLPGRSGRRVVAVLPVDRLAPDQ